MGQDLKKLKAKGRMSREEREKESELDYMKYIGPYLRQLWAGRRVTADCMYHEPRDYNATMPNIPQ